jgi:hypothetical protein
MLAAAGGATQRVHAGRDAYTVARDQTIVNYRRPASDLGAAPCPLTRTPTTRLMCIRRCSPSGDHRREEPEVRFQLVSRAGRRMKTGSPSPRSGTRRGAARKQTRLPFP